MYEPPIRDSSTLLEVQIRRRVFWSAYSIDRLISWIYHVPCSVIDENIQTEVILSIVPHSKLFRSNKTSFLRT